MQESSGHSLMEFTAGMRVGPDGRYEIVRICGRGGMGIVYEGVDHGLDRPRQVAIKQLNKMFAGDPRHIDSVRREVAIARDLGHPNILRVYEYVEWRDEHLVVMEWIGGGTLVDALCGQPEKRYSPEQALELLKPIASALDYAHRRKPPVVHRDLKPLNVMLTGEGEVKVTDFGLSREVKESVTRVTGKESSGSLEYMPFEQFMGDPPHPSHDIYALGITAYELLNGQPPFTRGDIGLQHREKRPTSIEGVPGPVMAVLLKCLAKDSEDRYATAGEFVGALEAAIVGKVADKAEERRREEERQKAARDAARRSEAEKRPARKKSRSGLVAAIVALAVVAAVAAGFIVYSSMEATRWQETIDRHLSVGRAHLGRTEYEEAITQFARVLEISPGNGDAGDLLARAKKEKKAEEERQQQILRDHIKKGKDHLERWEYDKAISSFEEVLTLDPEHKDAKGLLTRTREEKISIVARSADGLLIKFENSTVVDTTTGLMWAAKDNGEDINRHDAKRYCEDLKLGGHSNWRMPTLDELKGLYNKSCSEVPQCNKSAPWSIHADPIIGLTCCCSWAAETDGSQAALFNYSDGRWYWNLQSKTYFRRILPVRGINRFIDNGDGTVTDTRTGLMWAAKDNGKDIDWPEAKRFCENLILGGHSDWRLPTQDELEGLYEPGTRNPNPSTDGCKGGYHISRFFQITCCCPWASEIDGSRAAGFGFHSGRRGWGQQYLTDNYRALPVRRGK